VSVGTMTVLLLLKLPLLLLHDDIDATVSSITAIGRMFLFNMVSILLNNIIYLFQVQPGF